jgi:intergrase/recombinase
LSYAKQYGHCLLDQNFTELTTLSDDKRGHVLKALSALAKFLGAYDEFKQLIRNYGLTWTGRSKDDIVIERISRIKDPGEIYAWIRQVKAARPELSEFMNFMAISGLRLEEAVNSYNLIVTLSQEDKLNEYYNVKAETLEHFRYKEIFIRPTKKAFISIVPKDFVEKIAESIPLKSAVAVQKRVQHQGLKLRFGDIREAHATFMTKYLKQPEIDFMHGRVSTNVFLANYYNPKLVEDLRTRTEQGIKEILEKVS